MSIETAESEGNRQFQAFVSERLCDASKPFFDSIPKNNLPLFNASSAKKTKHSTKKADMSHDVHFFLGYT